MLTRFLSSMPYRRKAVRCPKDSMTYLGMSLEAPDFSRVRVHINKRTGKLEYKSPISDLPDLITEAAEESSFREDMRGFCEDCGYYSDVKDAEEGKGYVFTKVDPELEETTADYKYTLLRRALADD